MGRGDWWNDVRITASANPWAARVSTNRSSAARSMGGAGFTTHGLAQTSTCATPGSSRPAAAPAGPQSSVTSASGRAATARIGRAREQDVAGSVEPGDEHAVGHAASPGLRADA